MRRKSHDPRDVGARKRKRQPEESRSRWLDDSAETAPFRAGYDSDWDRLYGREHYPHGGPRRADQYPGQYGGGQYRSGYGGYPAGYGDGIGAYKGYGYRTGFRSFADYERNIDWSASAGHPPPTPGPHEGKGPRGYRRSDERIREDACERIARQRWIDARDVEVDVHDGEITLSGTVARREDKRALERLVENIAGVHDVHNRLSLERRGT